ncbi:MAG: hypothetical protein WCJ18_06360 [Planctomycetota bacterium]
MNKLSLNGQVFGWCSCAAALFAAGIVVGVAVAPQGPPPKVLATTSLADDSFAVCTTPINGAVEALFMLDFETGDLSGGILNPNSTPPRFSGGYKHNVLKDLGFKAGQAKNPKFLLVSGLADMPVGGNVQFAQSVLYVTDSSTGTTVAYGIPWNAQQAGVSELVPLDVARPRGGGAKAAAAGVKEKAAKAK